MTMVSTDVKLSLRTQCNLLEVHRSLFYKVPSSRKDNTEIANKLVEIYQKHPVYGYRRLTTCLHRQGVEINRKCVLRLMRKMGLKAIYPGPKTTKSHPKHKKYPYILGSMTIDRPHQAWQTDITYLRTNHGFLYMNALIDMHSRTLVGWSLSNSLDAESCLRTLEKALYKYPRPEVINSDQGSQYTGDDWIKALKESGILISMSGRGRSIDNAHIERLWRTLKYEWTYLHGARTVADYKKLLPEFVQWYNTLRPHQALKYATPVEILQGKAYGYVDKANALPTISTGSTTTTKNSLIF